MDRHSLYHILVQSSSTEKHYFYSFPDASTWLVIMQLCFSKESYYNQVFAYFSFQTYRHVPMLNYLLMSSQYITMCSFDDGSA